MSDESNFLEGCLFYNTNTLSRYLLKIAQKEFKDLNLSPAHASLMLFVFDTPGVSPKELSHLLHLTPSTITRFIDALVKKDLLIRETRGKQAFIFPSLNGLALKAPIASAYKRMIRSYESAIGKNLARKINSALITTINELENNSQ